MLCDLSGNHFGQSKCFNFSIRLYLKVSNTILFFPLAKTPFQPALCKPSEIPPYPSKRSIYVGEIEDCTLD